MSQDDTNTTGPQAAQATLDAIARICASPFNGNAPSVIVAIVENPSSLSTLHTIAQRDSEA